MFCSGKSVSAFVLLVASSLASFAQSGPQNRILQAVEPNQYAVVPGSTHRLAQPQFDAGRVDGNMKLEGVSLVFKPSPDQQAALQALLQEQQDRSSLSFHKWLTPEQYADRFGMSESDLAKVTSWLQSEGFEVNRISRGRTEIFFTGTAAQIEAAFRTEMHHYLLNGEIHFANATELSVPAAFAPTVRSIRNLSDLRAQPKGGNSPNQSFGGLSPHYTDGTTGDHYLAPADFATIYGLNSLYSAGFNGTGQSIAIMGQTAIYTQDIDDFRTAAALPARTSTNFQQIQVPNSGNPAVNTNALGEADLDLEWSEAVAPNANLIFVFVGNNPTYTAIDALQYAVDNNTAPVISITYGECEQNMGSMEADTIQGWVQTGNSQGQTVIAASGDSGAADCDPANAASAMYGLAVDVPAAIPEVTGVGGTEFSADPPSITTSTYWNATNAADGGSAISYIPEITWNDSVANSELSASGGGASTFFPKPAWQIATNVPDDGARDVPDIALTASPDHDPYLVCSAQSCIVGFNDAKGGHSGGTSFGAPAFAGIVAIINQRTSSTQGNVNPTLYNLAMSVPTAFNDITTGSNIVPCTQGTPDCPSSGSSAGLLGYVANPGYDQTTGLGSLNTSILVNAWPLDYSFSVNPNRVTLALPGDQGTAAIVLDAVPAFTGTVNLTCTPQSGVAGLTCSISPTTVTPGGPNATVTIFTVGPGSSAARLAPNPGSSPGTSQPGSGPTLLAGTLSAAILFAGIFLIEIPFLRRRRINLPAFLLLAFLAATVGCGGSSSSSTSPKATPAGIYTVTVTGTSGSATFSVPVSVGVD
jgi:subtilase family serine protease